MMRLFRRKHESKKEHDEVTAKLEVQERRLEGHARRLRALELEVGIYKPPVLKEVKEK
jgi:hypothetical protein